MHTFQTYDLFRLSHFRERKPKIDFGETHSFTYYRFNEVDYFNYILFKTSDYDEAELDEILLAYLRDGRSQIKFLFPDLIKNSFSNLIQEETLHEIACLKQSVGENQWANNHEPLLTPFTNEEDLIEYTRIYLESFSSSNTDYKEVAQNFQLLMQDDAVDFFFVNYRGNRVGICSNYYGSEAVFLSAGAVLPPYRNHGLHKQIIAERIALAKLKGHTEFVSWAYTGSISYKNLIKSNFKPYASYCEYVSKPLEALTAAGGLLQR
jgi:GNAT superfamily N-acetyltransferase